MTSVTIPDSVTSIRSYTFYKCSSLTSITIPDRVTAIGDHAFANCSRLTSVTIPDSVTSIGSYAFYKCSRLTSVTIPDSVTSIGDYAFADCQGELIIKSKIIEMDYTEYDYPMNRESGWLAGSKFTKITIGENITKIGEWTFKGCSSLTSVTIPNSVTSIGSYAFALCSSLTSITIPDNVTAIGKETFCGCSSLTSITIPDSVTSIGSYAFADCISLNSVIIGNSVAEIGAGAFADCNNLASVHIANLSAWCKISFDMIYAEDKRYIYPGTTPLYYGAKLYLNGNAVTELVIPDDVTEIKDGAFMSYAGLTSVMISDSVTNLGRGAFFDCNDLTSITIGNSVTSIGYGTFSGCSCLPSIIIPDSVTEIREAAFYGCSSLTSVTIGKSVAEIGDFAFFDCSNLESVYCKSIIPPIGSTYMFALYDYGYYRIGSKIYVPKESVKSYKRFWPIYADDIEGYDFKDNVNDKFYTTDLTGNVTISIADVAVYCFGDYYNIGTYNWLMTAYDNTGAEFVEAEFFTAVNKATPDGVYTITTDAGAAGTAYSGDLYGGFVMPTYYVYLDSSSYVKDFALIKSGTFSIVKSGVNYNIDFNLADEFGNKVTGSYTGTISGNMTAYSAQALNNENVNRSVARSTLRNFSSVALLPRTKVNVLPRAKQIPIEVLPGGFPHEVCPLGVTPSFEKMDFPKSRQFTLRNEDEFLELKSKVKILEL